MADQNKLMELLKGLAGEGVNYGDVIKALKGLKDSGAIKSAGRGKVPTDDPLRNAIKSALLEMVIDGKPLLDQVIDVTTKAESTSFMVTINDDWKVNFVKSVERKPKEKKDKTAEPTDEFAEPAVV